MCIVLQLPERLVCPMFDAQYPSQYERLVMCAMRNELTVLRIPIILHLYLIIKARSAIS